MIVFGIKEKDKAATGRKDVGELDQAYERTLRSVAVSGNQGVVERLRAEGRQDLDTIRYALRSKRDCHCEGSLGG